MPVTYERVLVTPALAKKWLATNEENYRRPKTAKIPAYARDILAGSWDSDTGETIKFWDGKMIDGQNRMFAVIEAGVPVWFDVAYTTSDRAALVIDTGASRSAGDALRHEGVKEVMRASSVVRWTIFWDAKIYLGHGGRLNPTHSEVVSRLRSERGLYNAATSRGTDAQKAGLGNGSAAGVAFYLFSHIDQDQAHTFFDQVIGGEHLTKGCGPLLLRNRFTRIHLDRITRSEQLALYVRAWNAFREDRTLKSLVIVSGKLTNANFPQPR